jgi:uncharacterized SAM-binding protein YcdF (DUF218 family)
LVKSGDGGYVSKAGRGYVIVQSPGTPYEPHPLDKDGFIVTEAAAAPAAYLQGLGIGPVTVRLEELSMDTIGNAVLARLLHLDPLGICHAHIITSEFHMPHTR